MGLPGQAGEGRRGAARSTAQAVARVEARALPREVVRKVLVAAADAVFSDGVSESFLDAWTDDTVMLLAREERQTVV